MPHHEVFSTLSGGNLASWRLLSAIAKGAETSRFSCNMLRSLQKMVCHMTTLTSRKYRIKPQLLYRCCQMPT